jgi:hypothetical protein
MATNRMSQKIRVMALETDAVFDTTRARRGTFGDIFNELFASVAAEHDPPLEAETQIRFVVEPEGGSIPDLSELEMYNIQAVCLSGSKYDAFSNDEWIHRLVKWIQGLLSTLCLSHVDGIKMHGQEIPLFDSWVSASGTRSCAAH